MKKSGLLAILSLLISSFISAQDPDNTLGKTESASPDIEIGQFIMEMPFGAKLYKATDTNPEEFLGNLKKSFKGKAILIEFWAVWCSPCIKEMQYSKKLWSQSRELPVEFVYLCTSAGTTLNDWITKISLLKQPGIHIFADEKLEGDVADMFSKGGFPN